jgi:DNA-binding winged helix-turn-helix (wHTH) protein
MRLRFEDCLLDLGTRELLRGSETVGLPHKAFQLLELLLRQRPNAISKEDLHQGLWPDTFVVDGNLTNLVNQLRAALGDDSHNQRIIRTVQRFGYAFRAKTAELPAADAAESAGAGMVYRLLWRNREIALADGENLIGRDQGAAICVDEGSVSRHHARISIGRAGARLEDLESKNGTYVGGRKVKKPVPLKDGDSLRFGSVAMVFRRYEAGKSTETASSR